MKRASISNLKAKELLKNLKKKNLDFIENSGNYDYRLMVRRTSYFPRSDRNL